MKHRREAFKDSEFCCFKYFLDQSDCTIGLVEKSSENYILAATLDQFLESRMKKQMTDEMLWTEKVGPTMSVFD